MPCTPAAAPGTANLALVDLLESREGRDLGREEGVVRKMLQINKKILVKLSMDLMPNYKICIVIPPNQAAPPPASYQWQAPSPQPVCGEPLEPA